MPIGSSIRQKLVAAVAIAAITVPVLSPEPARQANTQYRSSVNSELVLVNVTVRDKQGNFIKDLKSDDFTVIEDGKQQKTSSFDFENIETAPLTASSLSSGGPAQILIPGQKPAQQPPAVPGNSADELRNRRLIVMFFDLSNMDPDQIERSVKTAQEYLDKRMT